MSDLFVFDVSSVVYTGATAEFFKDKTFYNYPVAGMHFFLRYLSTAIAVKDDVILCFDSPSKRMELLPKYKNGRVKNHAIISQIETLYEELQAIGIPCFKENGLEADDLVACAVNCNFKDYDEITIYSNDYDLCHNVRGSVLLRPLRKDMFDINYNNFSRCVVKGRKILFNTISAYKALVGCTSDCIPPLVLENGMRGYEIYEDFIKFIQENCSVLNYVRTSSPKTLSLYAQYREIFTDKDRENLAVQIQLVYPNYPKDLSIKPFKTRELDLDRYAYLLSKYGDTNSVRCVGKWKIDISENDKNAIREKAKLLNSGAFAADRNLEFNKISASTLRIDSFSKDY